MRLVFSMVLMHPVSPVHTAWLDRYGRLTDTSAVGASYTRLWIIPVESQYSRYMALSAGVARTFLNTYTDCFKDSDDGYFLCTISRRLFNNSISLEEKKYITLVFFFTYLHSKLYLPDSYICEYKYTWMHVWSLEEKKNDNENFGCFMMVKKLYIEGNDWIVCPLISKDILFI